MKTPSKKSAGKAGHSGKAQARPTTAQVLGAGTRPSLTEKDVPPEWAWHYRALMSARERLVSERQDWKEEAVQPMEAHSMDMADSASDQMDHDLALGAISAGQNILYEVEEALKRLAAGTYGICQESGRPIPATRLRAIPWARFSREVEEKIETQQGAARRHLGELGTVRSELVGGLEESVSEETENDLGPEEKLTPRQAPLGPGSASQKPSKKTASNEREG